MIARFPIAVLLAAIAVSVAAAQTPPYPVTMSVTAGKPDQDGYRTVRVTLAMAKGHHIYANPVGAEDFFAHQTALRVISAQPLADIKIVYPKGDVVTVPKLISYMVYRGTVVLQARVKPAAGDTGPLEVRVFLRADNRERCYLPKSFKQVVP